jgi:hypothetical protein
MIRCGRLHRGKYGGALQLVGNNRASRKPKGFGKMAIFQSLLSCEAFMRAFLSTPADPTCFRKDQKIQPQFHMAHCAVLPQIELPWISSRRNRARNHPCAGRGIPCRQFDSRCEVPARANQLWQATGQFHWNLVASPIPISSSHQEPYFRQV